MKPMKTLIEIANKIEWEGGLGQAFYYFGREVGSVDVGFNALWRTAHDAFMNLVDLLPEGEAEEGCEDE